MSKNLTVFSNAEEFASGQRMAMALSSSTMVPPHYRGNDNLGNTIIALEISQRMDASPLLVMQNLYLVKGQPSWSSKFLIATFNQSNRFSAIRYEWKGEEGKPDFGCRAWAMERATDQRVEGPWITWELVKAEGWDAKQGSKWKSMPSKMFCYRAAAWMIDTVAPELSMGLPPADQLEDIIDINPRTGEVIDIHSKKTTLADLKENSPRQTEAHDTAESNDGQLTDSNGEIYNQDIHATGKNGNAVYNSDGSFRARRGSHKKPATEAAEAHQDDAQPQHGNDEPASQDASATVSFAQIAEIINLAETQSEIDSIMTQISGLPEDQKGELRSLAHEKSKMLEAA